MGYRVTHLVDQVGARAAGISFFGGWGGFALEGTG